MDAGLTVFIAHPELDVYAFMPIARVSVFHGVDRGFPHGDAERVHRVLIEARHVRELFADLVNQLQDLDGARNLQNDARIVVGRASCPSSIRHAHIIANSSV
jgi:hypothetical protein